jgi:hypothetical protein
MLNDLYCKYYPHYRNDIVRDTDFCYRVLKYWNGSWKPDHYTKKCPGDLYYFKGYDMQTVSTMKQVNDHQRHIKHWALQKRLTGKRNPVGRVKPFWSRIERKIERAYWLNNPLGNYFEV